MFNTGSVLAFLLVLGGLALVVAGIRVLTKANKQKMSDSAVVGGNSIIGILLICAGIVFASTITPWGQGVVNTLFSGGGATSTQGGQTR